MGDLALGLMDCRMILMGDDAADENLSEADS